MGTCSVPRVLLSGGKVLPHYVVFRAGQLGGSAKGIWGIQPASRRTVFQAQQVGTEGEETLPIWTGPEGGNGRWVYRKISKYTSNGKLQTSALVVI